MLRRVIMVVVVVAVAAALVVLPMGAAAQTNDGGNVPSFLQLSVTQPNGFGSFPKRAGTHTYALSVPAQVTATDAPVVMTIGDGDSVTGDRHGHLVSGSTALPAALQVSVGSKWLGLDATADPLLAQWTQPVTRAPATIRLRQRVTASGQRTGYHKLLLVTVSAQSP